MPRIFLLTAPFDEKANTGDGQYADSLEMGFKINYDEIECTWLKKGSKDYTIPFPPGVTSIPKDTIPSAIVLQPVANENTVISGYQLLADSSDGSEAENVNEITVSPRTPKIILNADGTLRSLTIMDIYTKQPITLDREKVDFIIKTLDEKQDRLDAAIKENIEELKDRKPQTKLDVLIKLYNQNKNNIQKYCSLNEYIEAHLEKRNFDERLAKTKKNIMELQPYFNSVVEDQALNNLKELTEHFTGIMDYCYAFHSYNLSYEENDLKQYSGGIILKDYFKIIIEKNIINLKLLREIRLEVSKNFKTSLAAIDESDDELNEKIAFIKQIYWDRATFYELYDQQQFINALLTPNVEEQIKSYQDLLAGKKLNNIYKKTNLSAKEGFDLAYQANRHDPMKPRFAETLIKSMNPIEGDRTILDIHIRPPDCGVYISPEDIRKIKEAGIYVNITIHEYKQNYTRRYLQQYTHDLMREANSVQFFNEKDKKNAIAAAKSGDCDKRNVDPEKKEKEVGKKKLEQYPIEIYDLLTLRSKP